jgi:type II secretory pathway pseudopilin PulG
MTNRRHNVGVTLIEMLVVVGVLALLAGFVVSMTRRQDNQGKERSLEAVFLLLKSALMEYHEDTGTFPEQAEEDFDEVLEHGELLYEKLRSVPASREIIKSIDGSFVKGDASADDPLNVYDPWGEALDYRYDPNVGNFPELISAGRDKTFDTDDDISSKVK